MALSKIARYCLTSSAFFAQDILHIRDACKERNKQRSLYGEFHTLYKVYRMQPEKFYEYTKVTVRTFDYILKHIRSDLEKTVNAKKVVTPPEQLFLTLRYLADGTSFSILAKSFRLGRTTVSVTIAETLKAMWKRLKPIYMPPLTRETLMRVSQQFYLKWKFPNCIGAIGVKHCRVRNRCKRDKLTFPVHAISDANGNFLTVEVGKKIQPNDGTTFNNSNLNTLLETKNFNAPPVNALPGSNITAPYVLIGDETYPLKSFLLRPFPANRYAKLDPDKAIFNKKILEARTSVECAFAVISWKWNVLNKVMEPKQKHLNLIIKVTFLLYNLLRQVEDATDEDFYRLLSNFEYPSKKKVTKSKSNNRGSSESYAVRDLFKKYLVENEQRLS